MALFKTMRHRLKRLGMGSKRSKTILSKIMVAKDNERPFLGNLPPEILRMVLEVLHSLHRPSFIQLSMVCSYLYVLAHQISDKTIELDLTVGEAESKTRDLLKTYETRDLLSTISTIRIVNAEEQCFCSRCLNTSFPTYEPSKDVVPSTVYLLQGLIPRMINLQEVYWLHTTWCHLIIDVLNELPRVQLFTKYISPPWSPQRARKRISDSFEYSIFPQCKLRELIGSSILTSLDIRTAYTGRQDLVDLTRPIRQILLTCQNLKSLTLAISIVTCICTSPSQPYEYGGIGLVNGEKPAPLEVLNLLDYPFHLQCTIASGYPGSSSEQKDWAEYFDWHRLKELYTFDMEFASRVAASLSSIEKVALGEIRWNETIDQVSQFYRDIPTMLKSLTVVKLAYIAEEDIFRHGEALEELEIHQNECSVTDWRDGALQVSFLQKLRNSCPRIKFLRIDLYRSEDWPWEALQIISSFRQLVKLTLWLELGTTGGVDLTQPVVKFDDADMLFRFIQRRARICFQELKIAYGSRTGFTQAAIHGTSKWLRCNSSEFRFVKSDNQDKAKQGIYSSEVLGVPPEYNQFLRGEITLQQLNTMSYKKSKGKQRSLLAMEDERLRIAKNGPVSRDKWVDTHPETCTIM